MRQAGSIPNEADAQQFVDHLLALGIEAKADASDNGWAIWIFDETRLGEGKSELQQFVANPSDAKYAEAGKKADAVRKETAARYRQASKNVVDMRHRWASPGVRGRRPLTFLLIALSVLVGVLTNFGKDQRSIDPYLFMTAIRTHDADEGRGMRSAVPQLVQSYNPTLPEIRHGELWRLITPIFIHGNFLHLLFNMYWLWVLGGMIEDRYGSWWLLALVLITAVFSNLAQCLWEGPIFQGMSGVNYALFGYVWMKSKFDPAAGLYIGERDVFLMVLWFVICFTGWLGPIANGAHAGGLISGAILGYLPKLLRR